MRKGGRKKYAGGLLKGPSHEQGGIPAVVGGKYPIELEGEEFVVNADAARAVGTPFLEKLNRTQSPYHSQPGFGKGELPGSMYKRGGKIGRKKMRKGGRPRGRRMQAGGHTHNIDPDAMVFASKASTMHTHSSPGAGASYIGQAGPFAWAGAQQGQTQGPHIHPGVSGPRRKRGGKANNNGRNKMRRGGRPVTRRAMRRGGRPVARAMRRGGRPVTRRAMRRGGRPVARPMARGGRIRGRRMQSGGGISGNGGGTILRAENQAWRCPTGSKTISANCVEITTLLQTRP